VIDVLPARDEDTQAVVVVEAFQAAAPREPIEKRRPAEDEGLVAAQGPIRTFAQLPLAEGLLAVRDRRPSRTLRPDSLVLPLLLNVEIDERCGGRPLGGAGHSSPHGR
jgi:hypothetical protein